MLKEMSGAGEGHVRGRGGKEAGRHSNIKKEEDMARDRKGTYGAPPGMLDIDTNEWDGDHRSYRGKGNDCFPCFSRIFQ